MARMTPTVAIRRHHDWVGAGALCAGAGASAHAFLQESFVGLILGWHRDPAAASAAASAVAPKVARSAPGVPA